MVNKKEMNQRKAVFLDIDGTLVTFQRKFPSSARLALEKARSAGHLLFICTGRTPSQIYPWLLETGLFDGIVAGAGSDVRAEGEIIFQHFVDRKKLLELIHWMNERQIYLILQGSEDLYADEKLLAFHRSLYTDDAVRQEREKLLGHVEILNDIEGAPNIEKIAYYHSTLTQKELQEAIGPYFSVTESSISRGGRLNGEITVRGFDKALGMKYMLDHFGLSREDSIGFGDSENDLPMMNYAGLSVAMGNGSEPTKEAADLVTAPIEEDGLYQGFVRTGLIS